MADQQFGRCDRCKRHAFLWAAVPAFPEMPPLCEEKLCSACADLDVTRAVLGAPPAEAAAKTPSRENARPPLTVDVRGTIHGGPEYLAANADRHARAEALREALGATPPIESVDVNGADFPPGTRVHSVGAGFDPKGASAYASNAAGPRVLALDPDRGRVVSVSIDGHHLPETWTVAAERKAVSRTVGSYEQDAPYVCPDCHERENRPHNRAYPACQDRPIVVARPDTPSPDVLPCRCCGQPSEIRCNWCASHCSMIDGKHTPQPGVDPGAGPGPDEPWNHWGAGPGEPIEITPDADDERSATLARNLYNTAPCYVCGRPRHMHEHPVQDHRFEAR